MQATATLVDTETGELVDASEYTCEQFALCPARATCFVDHPILEWVPTCDRCLDRLERMR